MGAAAVPRPEKVFCKILSKITMYIIENNLNIIEINNVRCEISHVYNRGRNFCGDCSIPKNML